MLKLLYLNFLVFYARCRLKWLSFSFALSYMCEVITRWVKRILRKNSEDELWEFRMSYADRYISDKLGVYEIVCIFELTGEDQYKLDVHSFSKVDNFHKCVRLLASTILSEDDIEKYQIKHDILDKLAERARIMLNTKLR